MEYVDGGFLLHREIVLLQFDDSDGTALLTASELVGFLSLVRKRTHDAAAGTEKPPADFTLTSTFGKNILRFASLYFDEIRTLICKGNKRSLSSTSHAAIAATAVWLTNHLGVDSKVAIGVAVAILIAILKATKGAYCRMTVPEAKVSLDKAAKLKPKRK